MRQVTGAGDRLIMLGWRHPNRPTADRLPQRLRPLNEIFRRCGDWSYDRQAIIEEPVIGELNATFVAASERVRAAEFPMVFGAHLLADARFRAAHVGYQRVGSKCRDALLCKACDRLHGRADENAIGALARCG